MIPADVDAFESNLPPAGVYRLTIRLHRPIRLRVGRLGRFDLPAGVYVYCGSAQRNLPARVARHCRKRKPKRWHIDYLTCHRAAEVVKVETRPGARAGECEWTAETIRNGGEAVIPGFGSSDCRRCAAHLLKMPS